MKTENEHDSAKDSDINQIFEGTGFIEFIRMLLKLLEDHISPAHEEANVNRRNQFAQNKTDAKIIGAKPTNRNTLEIMQQPKFLKECQDLVQDMPGIGNISTRELMKIAATTGLRHLNAPKSNIFSLELADIDTSMWDTAKAVGEKYNFSEEEIQGLACHAKSCQTYLAKVQEHPESRSDILIDWLIEDYSIDLIRNPQVKMAP